MREVCFEKHSAGPLRGAGGQSSSEFRDSPLGTGLSREPPFPDPPHPVPLFGPAQACQVTATTLADSPPEPRKMHKTGGNEGNGGNGGKRGDVGGNGDQWGNVVL